MKRRFLALVLALALMVSVLVLPAGAENSAVVDSGTCGDGLTWTLSEDGTLTISGTGAMTDWDYTSYVVWKDYRSSITSVIIEDGVTSIGKYAFYRCQYLTSVSIPDSVTVIGAGAFSGCTRLQSIALPDTLTSLGSSAFASCAALSSITLPDGLTAINGWTFYNCTSLTSITIPEGVTSIGYLAFEDCTGLLAVSLPESLTFIDDQAFEGCTSLTEIVIPDGVTEISLGVFMACTSLTTVTMGDSVTTIGEDAFYLCSSLTTINLPEGLVSIGEKAFYGCVSLTALTTGTGLRTIGSYAFYGCTGLTSLLLSEGIVEIGSYAFHGCTALTYAVLPVSLTDVGNFAFYGCTGLTDVYYAGTETDWDAISFGSNNTSLTSAVIHLNSNGPEDWDDSTEYQGTADSDAGVTVGSLLPGLVLEEATIDYNLSWNNYGGNWYLGTTSYLFENGDGTLTRVQTAYMDEDILIEIIDAASGSVTSSFTLESELGIWGGFYAGEEYNFLVFGQSNPDEDDSVEVVRIVKYSKDWERLDACSIYGANTYLPFAYYYCGGLSMTEADGNLYIHTNHTMYAISGVHHQANMTFVIDETEMTVVDSCYGVSNISSGYVSHSFNQLIQTDGEYIYRVDHGDAYPRAVSITKASTDASVTSVTYTLAFTIQGTSGDNATGVSIGGFALSADNCLIAGNSVEQDDADTYDASGQRNIFLTVTDQELESTQIIWLTDYTEEDGITPRTPQLVKITDDFFLILWEEKYDSGVVTTRMVAVNGEGEVLSDQVETSARLSDCQPILTSDGLVTWYVSDYSEVTLYQIDPYHLEEYAAADIQDLTLEAIADQTYTGSALEPEIVLKNGSDILEEGVDYTVSYSSNTSVGTATVTITGTGHYFGEIVTTFSIVMNTSANDSDFDGGGENGSSDDVTDTDGSPDEENDTDGAADTDSSPVGEEDSSAVDGNSTDTETVLEDFVFTDDNGAGTWSWAGDYIYACYYEGIITGYADGDGYSFIPGNHLTRAEAATIIARAYSLTLDETAVYAVFSDDDGTGTWSWAGTYIYACVQAGILNGYEDGTYKPDQTVTRVELAKMIAVAEALVNDDTEAPSASSFCDVSASHWGLVYIEACVDAGIINGYAQEDGTYTFLPSNNVTRAEAATMIARALALV